jgi:hypothetical protein
MKSTVKLVATAALAVSLTGCGGPGYGGDYDADAQAGQDDARADAAGEGGTPPCDSAESCDSQASANAEAWASSATKGVGPNALAGRLACLDTYREPHVGDGFGSCELDGVTVHLYTFANNQARDQFIETAKDLGGRYVTGPNYAIGYPQ